RSRSRIRAAPRSLLSAASAASREARRVGALSPRQLGRRDDPTCRPRCQWKAGRHRSRPADPCPVSTVACMRAYRSWWDVVIAALVGWGVNVLALLVINKIFTSVSISGWTSFLIGAAVLGLANAFLKPVLAFLTLPLIIVTLGLGYFALNVAMLALA